MFKNGNGRITRLLIFKLAWGGISTILIMAQPLLPSMTWMDPKRVAFFGFMIAIALIVSKQIEAFFDKTASLLSTGKDPDHDPELPQIRVSAPANSPAQSGTTQATNITVEQTTKEKVP